MNEPLSRVNESYEKSKLCVDDRVFMWFGWEKNICTFCVVFCCYYYKKATLIFKSLEKFMIGTLYFLVID